MDRLISKNFTIIRRGKLVKLMIKMIIFRNFKIFYLSSDVSRHFRRGAYRYKKKRRYKKNVTSKSLYVLPLKFIKFTKDRVDQFDVQMIVHRERNLENDVRVNMIIRRQM